MAPLIGTPPAPAPARPVGPGPAGRRPSPVAGGLRLALAGLLGGAGAAAIGLTAVLLPVFLLWIFTPYQRDGMQAETHVVAGLWLLAQGVVLARGGVPVGVAPLLLTALSVLLLWRTSARTVAARHLLCGARGERGTAVLAAVAVCAGYLLIAEAAAFSTQEAPLTARPLPVLARVAALALPAVLGGLHTATRPWTLPRAGRADRADGGAAGARLAAGGAAGGPGIPWARAAGPGPADARPGGPGGTGGRGGPGGHDGPGRPDGDAEADPGGGPTGARALTGGLRRRWTALPGGLRPRWTRPRKAWAGTREVLGDGALAGYRRRAGSGEPGGASEGRPAQASAPAEARGLRRAVPGLLAAGLRGGAAGAVALTGGGALVLVVTLLVHAGADGAVAARLAPDLPGRCALLLLCLAYVPNAAVWGAAYALGTGVAFGAQPPAFPLLGALPDPGPVGLLLPLAAGSAVAAVVGRAAAGGEAAGPPAGPVRAAAPGRGVAFPAPGASAAAPGRAAPAASGAYPAEDRERLPTAAQRPWGICATVLTALAAAPCTALLLALLAELSGGPLGLHVLARVGPDPLRTGLAAGAWTAAVAGAAAPVFRGRVLRTRTVPGPLADSAAELPPPPDDEPVPAAGRLRGRARAEYAARAAADRLRRGCAAVRSGLLPWCRDHPRAVAGWLFGAAGRAAPDEVEQDLPGEPGPWDEQDLW